MVNHSHVLVPTAIGLALLSASAYAQRSYDFGPTTAIVDRGIQALMLCNGLFVSNRTIEQIYDAELRLNQMPLAPPADLKIDNEQKTVAVGVGGSDAVPTMRAAYREGLGCIVMSPDQTFDQIAELPILRTPPLAGDPETIPWPDGDLVGESEWPESVRQSALNAAADWAFDRKTHGHPSHITLSLMVLHNGDILLERYAPGVDMTSKTRTWSTAKSIAGTLIGIAFDNGKLVLDAPLPFEWGPAGYARSDADPRRRITLRHVLNMSSGLYPVDNPLCSATGSCLGYFAGVSLAEGARNRGLVREPGTVWDYENYDTLLGVLALKRAIGDDPSYLEFPRKALFDRIGMRNTIPGVDRFGDFVLSSQVYSNARDLARLGLLYLNGGVWNGERLLSQEWIDFSRTPAPSTAGRGNFYGGQWWIVPDDRTDLPQDAYSTSGSRGQHTILVPSYDLVIVRRGLDWLPRQHSFPYWDLLGEVLKAFPDSTGGSKLSATP